MKKILLIGLLFICGCLPPTSEKKALTQQDIINLNNDNKPRKVADVEGRELWMVKVEPFGDHYRIHYVYYFKDGEVKSVNYNERKGKNNTNTTLSFESVPYKKQEVPNE
jgi:hypothetical protein